jgi:hypothetical protein
MLHLALKFPTSQLQSAHTLVVSQSLYIYIYIYIYIHVLVACPSREKYLQKSLPRIWTLDSETCMHFRTFFSPLLLQWVLRMGYPIEVANRIIFVIFFLYQVLLHDTLCDELHSSGSPSSHCVTQHVLHSTSLLSNMLLQILSSFLLPI